MVVATGVSLLAMQHYLLQRVDQELMAGREAILGTGLTQAEIESFQEMSTLLEHVAGAGKSSSLLPVPNTVLVALDPELRPTRFARHPPTGRQLELAAAVKDPAGLAARKKVIGVEVGGADYRVVGARLPDDSLLIFASDVESLKDATRRALKVDAAAGAVLLALLALGTMMSTRHLVRPLEHMVETASAIAEGDLTRRVPPGQHPVGELEQLRTALNAMLHQVESAFETRERSAAQLRQFVADASHELRTPLSAIRGYLQLYERGMLEAPGDRTRALSRMHTEADRMAKLVEELLMLARLDQRPELRFGPVDLGQLARDAAGDLSAQQPLRPVTTTVEPVGGGGGGAVVLGDELSLRQLVGNLLANVRVHTPGDAAVRVAAGPGPDGTVRLLVADEGPGLAPEDAERIFDRFFRAGTGGPGSGLGMSIVRAVAEVHGGSVRIRTAPGEGLTVTVTLPAAAGAGAA
ncbi:HAMP domain-containing histidine kinase [Streptomyces qinzhouensis]|uniref:histidine kinase n=1 Tax=Streptomyces qinzhouensis TaxID=2599401 RepID=A0A5B8JI47_9ACTN|nr:HAMP domain-containing histidine kinase [Streptomyces qinzhouensis]